jgi:hypothetical protein
LIEENNKPNKIQPLKNSALSTSFRQLKLKEILNNDEDGENGHNMQPKTVRHLQSEDEVEVVEKVSPPKLTQREKLMEMYKAQDYSDPKFYKLL